MHYLQRKCPRRKLPSKTSVYKVTTNLSCKSNTSIHSPSRTIRQFISVHLRFSQFNEVQKHDQEDVIKVIAQSLHHGNICYVWFHTQTEVIPNVFCTYFLVTAVVSEVEVIVLSACLQLKVLIPPPSINKYNENLRFAAYILRQVGRKGQTSAANTFFRRLCLAISQLFWSEFFCCLQPLFALVVCFTVETEWGVNKQIVRQGVKGSLYLLNSLFCLSILKRSESDTYITSWRDGRREM